MKEHKEGSIPIEKKPKEKAQGEMEHNHSEHAEKQQDKSDSPWKQAYIQKLCNKAHDTNYTPYQKMDTNWNT